MAKSGKVNKKQGKTPAIKGGKKPAAKPKPKAAGVKPAKAAAPKPAAKPAAKAGKSKPGVAKRPAGKTETKVAGKPAAPAAPVPPNVATSPAAGAGPAGANLTDKNKPKGITIVNNKPQPPRKPKPKKVVEMPSLGAPLLGPGAKKWKPLIPSGPNNSVNGFESTKGDGAPAKTHLGKKELDRYREMLLRKRAELVGDVSTMESQALHDSSGSLSHLPQHMAEQGSEAYDQALSLDLAAQDRTLIREIDDALARIAAGTYGVCELSGKPISKERLDELPWTRHSIEAAREMERRSFRS